MDGITFADFSGTGNFWEESILQNFPRLLILGRIIFQDFTGGEILGRIIFRILLYISAGDRFVHFFCHRLFYHSILDSCNEELMID